MKKIRRLLLVLLALGVLQLLPAAAGRSQQVVYAATRQGLTRIGSTPAEKRSGYSNRYVYYRNGKRVKKEWVTVGRNRYYFGPNGKALQAPEVAGFMGNIIVTKIGNNYYGFDTFARMVVGYKCTASLKNPRCFYFNADGTYNKGKTKEFRKAISKGTRYDIVALTRVVGTTKDVRQIDVCLGENVSGELWTYNKCFQVQVKINDTTGVKQILQVSAAQANIY